jgi:hypothetical protein
MACQAALDDFSGNCRVRDDASYARVACVSGCLPDTGEHIFTLKKLVKWLVSPSTDKPICTNIGKYILKYPKKQ